MYDDVTQKPCLHGMDSPLYMNYRCNAYQARHCSPDKAGQTLSKVCMQSSLYMQVPIKLLHPVFGKFERLAETVRPTIASLNFVQTVCAQAKYYYASEEKDYQHVMRRVWTDLLVHLGGVSRPAVGATGRSVPGLALAVSTPLSCQLVLFDPAYHSCDACAPFSEHSVASDTSQLYALHDFLNTTCRHRMDWFV